jgi:hypothetical protein
MQNSKTDKLTGSAFTSSSDKAKFSSIPTGTFSGGIVLDFDTSSISLLQTKENISDLTKKAKDRIKRYKNKSQVKQALNALDNIDKLLSGYEDLGLPEFNVSEAADKSIGISWRFPRALFGIFIQPNTIESSWFLIMGDIEKGLKADGNLDDLDYELQLSPLFDALRKLQTRKDK